LVETPFVLRYKEKLVFSGVRMFKSRGKRIQGETIWVTGATSGIGRALALELASAGNRVVVSGRSAEALEDLVGEHRNLMALTFDVTDAGAVQQVKGRLTNCIQQLNRVVINAGTCEYLNMEAEAPDWSIMGRMIDTNYLGAVNTVAVCMDLLKKTPRSQIVGISSQVLALPFPKAEAYGASKAALDYFLSSLRIDLKRHDIDVSVIHPGFVDTPLTRKNTFPMPFIMGPREAAERIITAMHRRCYSAAFPKRLTFLLWSIRQFPKTWVRIQSKATSVADSNGDTVSLDSDR